MTTPAIVLVHGFWGGAAHWAKVVVELSRQGYSNLHARLKCRLLLLPTISRA